MRLRPALAFALPLALAAGLVASVRGPLAARWAASARAGDVHALPAPEQTVVLSLGYRSALADYLFANTLVQAGIHIKEKRRFEFVAETLDVINALDPSFRAPYMYADTLITVQASPVGLEDYRRARRVLERGLQAFPNDQELWLTVGQYIAYLTPPRLPDREEAKEWKAAGARVLARTCELGGVNENIPYHCVTAARLLSAQGELAAAERFVERLLAVVDDEEIRKLAVGYLARVQGESVRERAERRARRFSEAVAHDLSWVSKDLLLVVGPRLDTARCAGGAAEGCATTWRDWAAALPAE